MAAHKVRELLQAIDDCAKTTDIERVRVIANARSRYKLNGADADFQFVVQNKSVGIFELANIYRKPFDKKLIDLLESCLSGGATIESAR